MREGRHEVAGNQKFGMITRGGKTDTEMRIKMKERKQDAKELLPETLYIMKYLTFTKKFLPTSWLVTQ